MNEEKDFLIHVLFFGQKWVIHPLLLEEVEYNYQKSLD